MLANGRSVLEICKNLGISESMVYRWQQKSKPRLSNQREEANQLQDLQVENERLKAQLRRELRLSQDFGV